ncbi:MAG: hypothetical protein HQ500_08130 [Flavobacteriales bacterium]|nr:hypothetical protein [Flavobacteriales bacterium]
MMKSLIINTLIFLCWSTAAMAQLSYDDVRYEDIPLEKIRNYLVTQRNQAEVERFSELQASCEDLEDFDGFYQYEKKYLVKLPLIQVWHAYKRANPTEAWTTNKSTCGLMYERASDRIVYPNDTVDGINIGQILYMDLNLIQGLYHMATAFEITKVEDESGVFEVSYLKRGFTEGKQIVRMYETEKGYTRIVHQTFMRSGRKFRDKVLYPYFHNRLINSFHRKMKHLAFKLSEHNVD